MRKLILGAAAAIALAAGPAAAEFDVDGSVRVHKDKTVVEWIGKLKVALVGVVVIDRAEVVAESQTIVNQDNFGNHACENCAEKRGLIRGSLNNNSGLTSVNQATGNMNNQGTAVSFAFDADAATAGPGTDTDPISLTTTEETPPPTTPDVPDTGNGATTGFADSHAAVGQVNKGNTVDTINIIFRDSIVENSGNGNQGLLYVNQAAGNMNNQANALSVAVALAPGVALSESDLGQLNSHNTVTERNVIKNARVSGSFNRNSGVVGVNQSSGNFANQANVLSISAAR